VDQNLLKNLFQGFDYNINQSNSSEKPPEVPSFAPAGEDKIKVLATAAKMVKRNSKSDNMEIGQNTHPEFVAQNKNANFEEPNMMI
jgi:hypothetical protein